MLKFLSNKFLIINFILFVSCHTKYAGKYDELLNQFPFKNVTDSIALQPKQDSLYFHRAILLNKNELTEPALSDFELAWSLHKNEAYAFGIAKILVDKNDTSAENFIHLALQNLPKSNLLKLILIQFLNKQNKFLEALTVCDQMLTQTPDNIDVLKLQAELYDNTHQNKLSTKVLQKIHSLVPLNIDISNNLANHLAENKEASVLNFCDTLIAKSSIKIPEPHYNKGIYYANIHLDEQAIKEFNLAILAETYFMPAYIEKGKIFFNQNNISEAMKIFKISAEVSPTLADAYYWEGKCFEQVKDTLNARLNYLRAFELDKTFSDAKLAADDLK